MEQSRLIKLYRQLARKNVPVKVRLEITRLCNLRCIHCKMVCNERVEGELTADDLSNILPQLNRAGASHLNMTGGEMFARHDIAELLDVVFAHDYLVNLQTNATLIGPEHVVLLERNKDRIITVNISVYAADPEVHERITGVKGSFGRTMDALRALQAAGIPVAVFCLLMAENAPYYKETQNFFEREKINFQFGSLMIAREDGCVQPLEHRVGDELLGELPIPWDGYLNPDPKSIPDYYPPDTPLTEWCITGRFPTILPNGDLVPCSVIRTPVGNLREKSFEELWRGSPLLDYLRSLRVKDLDCRDCEYFPRCKPCIGMAFDEHGRYTARPSEYCRLSRKFLK